MQRNQHWVLRIRSKSRPPGTPAPECPVSSLVSKDSLHGAEIDMQTDSHTGEQLQGYGVGRDGPTAPDSQDMCFHLQRVSVKTIPTPHTMTETVAMR